MTFSNPLLFRARWPQPYCSRFVGLRRRALRRFSRSRPHPMGCSRWCYRPRTLPTPSGSITLALGRRSIVPRPSPSQGLFSGAIGATTAQSAPRLWARRSSPSLQDVDGQGADEIPPDAHFGVWCTPLTGVTLTPGQSVSGSVTLRPGSGGPPDYTVYSAYNDPITGVQHFAIPRITQASVVAPAATDIQITGAASNGAPPVGSTFTYAYQVKNAGPWGTYGGIIFVDTPPASLTYVGSFGTFVSPSTGQPVEAQVCSAVGQTITCPLSDMQNGGTTGQATITLTVTASSVAQRIGSTASVHTVLPQTDSNSANNSVTVTVTTK
jgi:uncharacterized repeat protein (TIGR01451 family)